MRARSEPAVDLAQQSAAVLMRGFVAAQRAQLGIAEKIELAADLPDG